MDCKKIIIDCDGVLTDGKFWVSSNGDISKGFHTRDIRAIRELIANGFEVVIVTASSWPGIDNFVKKTGAEVIVERDKSKIDSRNCIVIADDCWDVPLFNNAKVKYCPKDASIRILIIKDVIKLDTCGGCGVIAELANKIINN